MKSRLEIFYQRYGDVINVNENVQILITENGTELIDEIKSPRNITLSELSFKDLS
jgi:hypothetical protein